VRAGANNFIANVTIKNVGSTTISISSDNVFLNITGTIAPVDYLSRTTLPPGATAAIGFAVTNRWPAVADRETVSGVLIIREVGTMEVVFRVVKPS
jgi:archaellum component FlaF (FlaF/FlaG flagellin family)